MGKNRDSMMRKLDAFEKEMNDYAIARGGNNGEEPTKFVMEKKLKIDLIQAAREPGASIEAVIESMRPKIKQMIDTPAFFVETKGSETLN
jgi:hypothetical protein